MSNHRPLRAALAASMSVLLSLFARADGPGLPPTGSPATDKRQYTLFNPVPDGQLRDMDTDRPNITNTPHTVDAGHWQIEMGVLDYSQHRDDSPGSAVRSDDLGLGQVNFRLGVLDTLELNAAINAYETDRTDSLASHARSRSSGFGDATVGGKLNLWGDEGTDAAGYTALAIQPQFKLPTAQGGLGNGRFEFSVAAPFLANMPGGIHLGLQPGISAERDSGNSRYVTGFPDSVSLDRVFFGNLDIYLEYAWHITTERHLIAPQTIDMGGTLPLARNVVLDAGINVGLNRASNNVEVLAGISIRH
jgi:Putative MetA-pathway of phenol degradation